jgi:hypothetical protein
VPVLTGLSRDLPWIAAYEVAALGYVLLRERHLLAGYREVRAAPARRAAPAPPRPGPARDRPPAVRAGAPAVRRAVLLAMLVLAGCGSGSGDEREARPAATPPATEVSVAVDPGGTRTITCPGDAACERLARADFSGTPDNVACIEIYGGDATARVRGRIAGKPVDARFSLANGCEINRWKEFAWLLGKPPSSAP